MFSIKSALVGAAAGGAIGALVTFLAVKTHYEKAFEQWREEFTMHRINLERERREKKERDEQPAEENEEKPICIEPAAVKAEDVVDDEYETAVQEYQEPSDEVFDEDEDELPERPNIDKLTDDDYHSCIVRMEENGEPLSVIAEEYGVSPQALDILIENYKTTKRREINKPKYPLPHNITKDEYETRRLEYEKACAIYYRGDNSIYYTYDFESREEQMIEIGKNLGKSSNLYDNREEDGYIYIRNDMLAIDYKILCVEGASYDET